MVDAFNQSFSLDGLGLDLGRCEELLIRPLAPDSSSTMETRKKKTFHPKKRKKLASDFAGRCFLSLEVAKKKEKKVGGLTGTVSALLHAAAVCTDVVHLLDSQGHRRRRSGPDSCGTLDVSIPCPLLTWRKSRSVFVLFS